MRKLTVPVAALLLAGCSGSSASTDSTTAVIPSAEMPAPAAAAEPSGHSATRDAPTAECLAGMSTADEDLQAHYKLYDTSKGEIDFEAEAEDFEAIIAPLYDACDGPHDLMAGFRAFPDVAGVTSVEFVDNFTLESYCYPEPNSRACAGYEVALALYAR